MNPDIALLIGNLALSLTKPQRATVVAQTLIKIVQAAMQAYQQHMGQPMNVDAIRPEETI